MKRCILDGRSLTIDGLADLVHGGPRADAFQLEVPASAREAVRAARQVVDSHVEAGDIVYGLTTGFGKLKSVAIAREDLERLQENLIVSHCCGVGEAMPRDEVRVMQVLRLNGLCRGHSGVRLELLDFLISAFHARFVPVVPRQGSVGASGDLAPLAHLAAAYMGHGEADVPAVDGEGYDRLPAAEALARVGLEPIRLAAKEGLALINGTECMKATGVAALLRARNLSKAADAICSLSIEALCGSLKPFDDRLAELKGHEGHRRTAENVRRLLQGSKVLKSHAECDRVQDPYSLRCVPQIHGAVKSAIAHVEEILAGEINAVTDNPILFPETGEVVSAGQFHGQPVSMVLDYLAIAVSTLANVSERRVEQLVNPDLSGLPAFLCAKPGLNSGFMIAQVAAAALASENKVHAHPASVDTVPTSANQEDHVSMGVTAARKALQVVANTESVLSIELLCAGMGRDFNNEHAAGAGAAAVFDTLRAMVEPMHEDRYLHADMEAALELLKSGRLVENVERAVGKLTA